MFSLEILILEQLRTLKLGNHMKDPLNCYKLHKAIKLRAIEYFGKKLHLKYLTVALIRHLYMTQNLI